MARAKHFLRIVGPILFLLLAFRFLDRDFFVSAFSSLTASGLCIAAVAVIVTTLLGVIRWALLLQTIGYRPSIQTLAAASSLGQGLNVLLPTGMIGDVAKVILVSDQERTPFSELLGTVAVDRILGLLGFMFVAASALLATDLHGVTPDSLSISPGFLGIVLVVAAAVFAAIVVTLDHRLPRHSALWRRGLEACSSLLKTVYGYRRHKQRLAWGFLISVLAVIPVCVALWFLALPFATVPPAIVALAVTGSTLINVLPISVNGLGSRDLVFILVFGAAGMTAEQAVVLSLAWFLITFMVSVALAGMALVVFPDLVSLERLKVLLKRRRGTSYVG